MTERIKTIRGLLGPNMHLLSSSQSQSNRAPSSYPNSGSGGGRGSGNGGSGGGSGSGGGGGQGMQRRGRNGSPTAAPSHSMAPRGDNMAMVYQITLTSMNE